MLKMPHIEWHNECLDPMQKEKPEHVLDIVVVVVVITKFYIVIGIIGIAKLNLAIEVR